MGKVYNGIMGLVVGDALGVPFEFKKRDSFRANDMTGFGTYNQPPGTWSDDSSMTLATLESLWRMEGVDPADIMENFWSWYSDADFTPHGEVFDIGGTTRKAMNRYGEGLEPLNCGCKQETDNGNGALMRILPLAFVNANRNKIRDVCDLTHAHIISEYACHIYIEIAKMLIIGWEKRDCVQSGISSGRQAIEKFSILSCFWRLSLPIWTLPRCKIKSSGYVVDTLEAAIWCFMNTESYKDCVLTAVNLGEDTDTVAAVAGGLAGLYYGVGGDRGIPEKWINQIAKKDWIKEMCDMFERDR